MSAWDRTFDRTGDIVVEINGLIALLDMYPTNKEFQEKLENAYDHCDNDETLRGWESLVEKHPESWYFQESFRKA